MKRQDKIRKDKKSQDKTRTHQVLCLLPRQAKAKASRAKTRRDNNSTRHGKGRKKKEKFKNCSAKYFSAGAANPVRVRGLI